jgi:hypothetical protein
MYGDLHQRGICVVTGSFISGWFTRCNFAVLIKIVSSELCNDELKPHSKLILCETI